jgi:hypothetical protein
MRRLADWFRRLFAPGIREPRCEVLPFTAEEFANLIYSGKPEDMKRLAEGFSQDIVSRVRAG